MTHGRELFELLREMALPAGDYAVFGSGPLLARGVIDQVNDLDVVCRGAAWERALELGTLQQIAEGVEVASTHDGAITFGTDWAYGSFDIDDMIDTAEMIDGVPCVLLEHVISFKRIAGRPKDLEHLRLLGE